MHDGCRQSRDHRGTPPLQLLNAIHFKSPDKCTYTHTSLFPVASRGRETRRFSIRVHRREEGEGPPRARHTRGFSRSRKMRPRDRHTSRDGADLSFLFFGDVPRSVTPSPARVQKPVDYSLGVLDRDEREKSPFVRGVSASRDCNPAFDWTQRRSPKSANFSQFSLFFLLSPSLSRARQPIAALRLAAPLSFLVRPRQSSSHRQDGKC